MHSVGNVPTGPIHGCYALLQGVQQLMAGDLAPAQQSSNTNGSNYGPACAQSLMPMDLMVCGCAMSLFQASQPASRIAS